MMKRGNKGKKPVMESDGYKDYGAMPMMEGREGRKKAAAMRKGGKRTKK